VVGILWVSFVTVLLMGGRCSRGERQADCQAGAPSGAHICRRLAQNCCASVEPFRAVVEDRPPETVSEIASKYPVAASRWWRTPAQGRVSQAGGSQAGGGAGRELRAQNWCASVEPLRAVVDDWPPVTMSMTESK
jgi:hypothetical protein